MVGEPPILAGVGILLASMGQWVAAIVANRIGKLIFFCVDQFIFTSPNLAAQWEVKERPVWTAVKSPESTVRSGEYDRTHDYEPEFRCEECSQKKTVNLKEKGVKVH